MQEARDPRIRWNTQVTLPSANRKCSRFWQILDVPRVQSAFDRALDIAFLKCFRIRLEHKIKKEMIKGFFGVRKPSFQRYFRVLGIQHPPEDSV